MPGEGLTVEPTGEHDERDEVRFATLREAVLLASDEKPGWRCDAILVMSVWVKEGHEAQGDMFATPSSRLPDLLRVVRSMPIPGESDD
jgi:hypothetical protein